MIAQAFRRNDSREAGKSRLADVVNQASCECRCPRFGRTEIRDPAAAVGKFVEEDTVLSTVVGVLLKR